MKVVEGVDFTYFDVDDTLVIWGSKSEDLLAFDNNGMIEMLQPNWEVIRFLKETKRHGGTVIVWSKGGWDWAMEVVKTLKLEEYVDLCITKPTRYVDDLHCDKWMGTWRKV